MEEPLKRLLDFREPLLIMNMPTTQGTLAPAGIIAVLHFSDRDSLFSHSITSAGGRRGPPSHHSLSWAMPFDCEAWERCNLQERRHYTEQERNGRCSSLSVTLETRRDEDFITSSFNLFTWPLASRKAAD